MMDFSRTTNHFFKLSRRLFSTSLNFTHPSSSWLLPSYSWLHPSSSWLHPSSSWLHPSSSWLLPSSSWLHSSSSWLLPPSSWLLPPSLHPTPLHFLLAILVLHTRYTFLCDTVALPPPSLLDCFLLRLFHSTFLLWCHSLPFSLPSFVRVVALSLSLFKSHYPSSFSFPAFPRCVLLLLSSLSMFYSTSMLLYHSLLPSPLPSSIHAVPFFILPPSHCLPPISLASTLPRSMLLLSFPPMFHSTSVLLCHGSFCPLFPSMRFPTLFNPLLTSFPSSLLSIPSTTLSPAPTSLPATSPLSYRLTLPFVFSSSDGHTDSAFGESIVSSSSVSTPVAGHSSNQLNPTLSTTANQDGDAGNDLVSPESSSSNLLESAAVDVQEAREDEEAGYARLEDIRPAQQTKQEARYGCCISDISH